MWIGVCSASPFEMDSLDPVFRKRVEFWIRVYTEVSTSEGLVHDSQYPEIVLEKLDFKPEESDYSLTDKQKSKKIENRVKEAKEFYRKLFLNIHAKGDNVNSMTGAEKRVYELYKNIDEPKKFFNAAHNKRVRLQRGLRERFIQGLYYSGRYLTIMEKIFKDHGVPVEITRLPFVESSFNLKARSKVGASGIWQFIRSTGKLYMRINETVDERNDPVRATEAAAMLLKQNYETLNAWPLAVTAYNHGRKGLMRAVLKVGSDKLMDIIESYKSRSFGFASSNFFAEFLAALQVERNSEKYFGQFERDKSISFSEFILNDYVSAKDLSIYTRIPMDTLIELNPGLSESVYAGKLLIPAGYVLRIPMEMRDSFLVRYNEIPPNKKHSTQKTFLQARNR